MSGALALIAVQGTARARAGPPAVKLGPGSQRAASAGGRHEISLCTPPAPSCFDAPDLLRRPSTCFDAPADRILGRIFVFLVSEVPLDLILERLHSGLRRRLGGVPRAHKRVVVISGAHGVGAGVG